MDRGVQIGLVAAQTGLTVDAIRFYERERLSSQPQRSAGGYRLYRQSEIDQLHFIRKAQELGFSLHEIREILIVSNEKTEACAHVRELIERKLTTVREKLRELKRLERQLNSSLAKCTDAICDRPGEQSGHCPVIEQLNQHPGR
ncbi:MAG: Cu(I)-responsive transcriptional regulator [Acidobacteriaceae bacterium]